MALTVLHAEVDNDSQTALTGAWTAYATIPSGSLTVGNRYLITASTEFDDEAEIKLSHTGAVDEPFTEQNADTVGGLMRWSTELIWTAVAAEDIQIRARTPGSGFITNLFLTAIDLDSDADFMENRDWFYTTNATNEVITSGTFGGESNPAQINFTPDGKSNYAVFYDVYWNLIKSGSGAYVRLRDTVNGTTIAQGGPAAESAGLDVMQSHSGFGILEQPPASPITLRTQLRSTDPLNEKDYANIFILRLNAFNRHGFYSNDESTTFAAPGVYEAHGSYSVSLGVSTDLVLFTDMKSETNASTPSGFGINTRVELDSTSIYDGRGLTGSNGTSAFIQGGGGNSGDTGSRVGPTVSTYQTGLAPAGLRLIDLSSMGTSTTAPNRLRLVNSFAITSDLAAQPAEKDEDAASANAEALLRKRCETKGHVDKFLVLNGATICVKSGDSSAQYESIGQRRRSYDGTLLTTRRAMKKEWDFSTTFLSPQAAVAHRGLIAGMGQSFPFDADLFSAKGIGPNAGGTGTLVGGDDGDPVVGNELRRYIQTAPGASNLADFVDTESQSGNWSIVDGVVSETGLAAFIGDSCNLISFDSAINATRGSADAQVLGAATALATYTASAYVKLDIPGTATGTIRARISDTANAAATADQIITLEPSQWTRIERTITVGALASTLRLIIEEDTIDSGMQLYVDGIQLETGSVATPLTETTRSASSVVYPFRAFDMNYCGATVSFWIRDDGFASPAPGSFNYFLRFFGTDGQDELHITTGDGDGTSLRFAVKGDEKYSDYDIQYTGAFTGDGLWHLVTAVYRQDPTTGSHKMELYYDGGLVNTGEPPAENQPTLSSVTTMRVGSFEDGTDTADFCMDDLQVLDYPTIPAFISDWFYCRISQGESPRMLAQGTFTDCTCIFVEGELGSIKYNEFSSAGANASGWYNAGEVITFKLQEV